ncbi:uncharacterized protein MYCGRDRAFT_97004 [Zymoseptoria tritici IPO323]|uniref:Uncharacterized protein n=1 Tax=Zymoseptoria tritici (strain CBS 115943 / IPO323) TaxID=336722 RepID=F9XNL0_ZYMTI|nr:uncharacterized protein MYCGRDRAFT_97004 [Zymoseptoria tritici IPO323]EGP82891.1 hypothetical protein MYCGRDRAFT_97004 [Zymoseptoria tritici IPO323]
MIQSPEEADDNITFDKFLNLPPELRERIYNIHLESLELGGLVNLSPPPITRTCQVVRHESLYAFRQRMMLRMAVGPGSVQLSRLSALDLRMTRRVLFTAFKGQTNAFDPPQVFHQTHFLLDCEW